jgi:ankyrin repeat protein
MGANVNARDIDGCTPLNFASFKVRVNVVRVLLDAGALVDTTDSYERTPLYCAICYQRVDVMRLLIDRGSKVCNVVLDDDVPAIPEWIPTFIARAGGCCSRIIGCGCNHRYGRRSWMDTITSCHLQQLLTFREC